MKTTLKKITSVYNLYTTVSIIGILFFFVYAFIKGIDAFDWISMANHGKKHFLDFFAHVIFSAEPEHLYERAQFIWGCFPPLIYFFYYFIYRITAIPGYVPKTGIIVNTYTSYMNMSYHLNNFLYYTIFVAFAILLSVRIWNPKAKYKRLFACLIFSVPFFAGGIERGNSSMIVFPLLLTALNWRNARSKVKREIAMLFIAISAGLKIYPAIFGLLYLKEQRFKEAARLIVYGIILFFGPFAFFGGLNGLKLWLENVSNAMNFTDIGCIEYINGLIQTITYWITGKSSFYLSRLFPNLFLIIMLGLAFISNDKYRTVFFLCAIMTFYPSNAYRYTLSYLAIPLVMYLMEHGNEQIKEPFIATEIICYSMIFSIPTFWGLLTGFQLQFAITGQFTYVEFWIYAVAYFLLFVVIVHELISIIKYKEYNPCLRQQIF